jgi:hypothetical protein
MSLSPSPAALLLGERLANRAPTRFYILRWHMTADQKRIAYVAQFMDGLGELDFHEVANEIHEKRCGCKSGPTERDYYRAVAKAIDEFRRRPDSAIGDDRG